VRESREDVEGAKKDVLEKIQSATFREAAGMLTYALSARCPSEPILEALHFRYASNWRDWRGRCFALY
jgi:hypothetical protein